MWEDGSIILTYVTSDITYVFVVLVLIYCFAGHVYRCVKNVRLLFFRSLFGAVSGEERDIF